MLNSVDPSLVSFNVKPDVHRLNTWIFITSQSAVNRRRRGTVWRRGIYEAELSCILGRLESRETE